MMINRHFWFDYKDKSINDSFVNVYSFVLNRYRSYRKWPDESKFLIQPF